VLTRYRAFLRYRMDSDWLEKMPKFDKIPQARADGIRTQHLTSEEYETLLDTFNTGRGRLSHISQESIRFWEQPPGNIQLSYN
jgi:hypothetical protein